MATTPLYIHIGTHKTGTTAVQSVFRENTEVIAEKTGTHFVHFPNRERNIRTETIAAVDVLREDLEAAKGTANQLFVSSESFCGSFHNLRTSPFGKPFYRPAAECARLLSDKLSTLPVEIKIIISLRRQDDFLESAYKQVIHQGGNLSLEAYLSDIVLGEDFRWDTLVDSYAEVFGKKNISLINYDVAKKAKGLLSEFEKIFGHTIMESTAPLKNTSFSTAGINLALKTHPFMNENQRAKLRLYLQRPEFAGTSTAPLIDAQKRAEIYDLYKVHNATLAQKYDIDQETPDALFAPHVDLNLPVEPLDAIFAKSLGVTREVLEAHSRLVRAVKAQSKLIENQQAELEQIKHKLNAIRDGLGD
jgi:hypothetical protein